MTDRELIEKELATCLDADVRARLIAALRAGPRTPEWSSALAIIGIRNLGRDVEPPKGWERNVMREIKQRQRVAADEVRPRRGRLTSALAFTAALALALAVGLLAGWYGIQLIGRWL